MKIKKQVPKLTSVLLSFAMAFSSVLPAYATDAIVTENVLEETELSADGENKVMLENDIDAQADSESRYEKIEVNYSQSSSYFVTIPKTITLGTDRRSAYSVKVEGDIVADKQVCVVPVDGIDTTEVFDFYMEDQTAGSTKENVVAEVSQAKFYWNYEDAAAGYEENDNYVIADGLSAGRWKGIFQMEISMRTDPSHIHNYVGEVTKEPTCTEAGEKIYACDCGDSYTDIIDPTGHHYENGECTDCGEKDPGHEHNYTETISKEPTCTEEGEKTYTCDCGDSYTEVISATGHHFENGECTDCGEKDPNHKHNYTETITKEPTCTEEGEKTYICGCGDSYTEKIPAAGHNYVEGECGHCGEKDPDYHKHNYTETITKEPACTEEGEKTYTCECGDSYTEKIPVTEHHYGDDDKCTECGQINPDHIHNYEPYEYILEPELTNSGVSGTSTYATKWYMNGHGSSTDYGSIADYDSYFCKNVHFGSYYKGDLRATFSIELPEDYEGTFDYQYYYSVTRNTTSGASVWLKVNNTYVYKNIDGTVTGTNAVIKTEPLGAGTNTFVVDFYTYNNASTNTGLSTSQYSDVTLKMYKIALYDGSEYHICDACGEKEAHHFVDGVCIECGWHESDHTHHYVDGICDKCGKSETQYNLVIDDSDYFINGIEGLSTSGQYVRDGDTFNLPEKTADGYDMDGYLIMKPLKTVYMCTPSKGRSSNAGNTYQRPNEAIYVYAVKNYTITEADNKYNQWASVGVKTGDTTSYGWNQTAESDIIEIEKPCVYVLDVTECDSDSTSYTVNDYKSYGITLHDITNSQQYNLLNLAGASQQSYDYGNIQILCKRVRKDNSYSYANTKSYRDVFMIYLQPGQYKLSSYGRIGNNNAQASDVVHEYYWQRFSNPVLSSESIAAPVINNVTDYVQGGCLYELVPVENGQQFDYAEMYTDKVASNNTNIYLISNWIVK